MKVKNLFFDIMTSSIYNKDLATTYRIMLLNTFLIFGTLFMGLTLIYRLFHPLDWIFIFIDICTSLSFALSFFWLRKTKNIKQISTLSSLIIIVFMLIFVHANKTTSLGIVWTYMIPIYVIFLNGYKKGGVLSTIFYLGVVCIFIFDGDSSRGWDTLSIVRYAMTSLILVSICLAYDYVFTKFQERLREQSRTDVLTGLNNRRSLDDILAIEVEKQKRDFTGLSFSIFDIDDFKNVNDRFGHLVGDKVLKEFAQIINSNIRPNDIAGRWGGEEFCLILPNTSLNEAIILLERLRQSISYYDFGIEENLTCSFGVSILTKNFNLNELIKDADILLYKAKKSGKNVVRYE